VVERRVQSPLLDLGLLRNRILVGATIAILIGAGTINALMYLLSLYFQDPASLGFSPLEAGLATLPATAGLVLVAPLVPKLAKKFGGRQVIGVGFVVTTAGFAAIGLADASWVYATFLLPLVGIAVGMGLSNGPSSSAATAAVPAEQVGEASGVSNMARYVGAAVATALAATIYGSVTANQAADGASAADALASGLAAASWVMAVFSALGILLALVAIRRFRAEQGTVQDAAASAAAHLHTLPTTASAAPSPPSR
jgi:MFS family permease